MYPHDAAPFPMIARYRAGHEPGVKKSADSNVLPKMPEDVARPFEADWYANTGVRKSYFPPKPTRFFDPICFVPSRASPVRCPPCSETWSPLGIVDDWENGKSNVSTLLTR